MRYLSLLLICLSSSAHAGIFGASTYAECVDEVVIFLSAADRNIATTVQATREVSKLLLY